jgi:predicted XRE-type DNA-binding protein
MTQEALAQRLRVTQPSISLAVRRGEQLAAKHGWKLLES